MTSVAHVMKKIFPQGHASPEVRLLSPPLFAFRKFSQELTDSIMNRKHASSLLLINSFIILPSVLRPGRPGRDPPVPLPWQRPPRLQEGGLGRHRDLRPAERVRRLPQPL